MEYPITLTNGLTGDDLAHLTIAVSQDGRVVNKSGLEDTSPITIAAFTLAGVDDTGGRPRSVSWADLVASDATLNVLGYRIVQKLADGREDVSEFTVAILCADY
jgi:hypothetical protein